MVFILEMSQGFPGIQLTDAHRLFLQAMMWKRIGDSSEILKIFNQSLEMSGVPLPEPQQMNVTLYEFVTAINNAIKMINLSIVKCIDEVNGKCFYALISGVDNHISRLSTEYSQAELEYFKRILESIVYSDVGNISSTSVLNLTHAMDKGINKGDAQETIKKFLRDKWLCQNKGTLYLSPRCIAELDYFITTNYPDAVAKCHLCQNTVIQAVRCAACMVKLHRHCMKKYLNEQNSCPSCNRDWEEYASSSEEEEEASVPSSSFRGRKRPHE